jgi:hypothetical protein
MALAACGGDGGSPTGSEGPAALAVAMGAAQSAVVGTVLQQPIGIKVTGASGKPLAGVTVNFAVRANSGSLSASSWKTNASGIASVDWTLGEKAGADVDTLEASVSGLSQTVIVTASATAGAPASLVVISGDAQVGIPGEQAAEPLVVEVRDTYGNARKGIVVSWAAEGGGTLSAEKDTTGADGRASVLWTLGVGDNRVTATIAELAEVRAPFTASLTVSDFVKLEGVSPDTLVEGGSATLTGSGFSTSAAGNKVFVDGAVAVVTSATETSLEITVPAFDCKPTRDAPVRVVVGSEGSNAVERSVKGEGTAVSLAVGQQLIVRDPTKFCLQLGESSLPASYLVGAQSVSDVASSVTPVTLSAAAAPSSDVLALLRPPAPLASRLVASGAALANVLATPHDQRWGLHREAEERLRTRERQLVPFDAALRRAQSTASARISALQVPGTAQVGDTISIKFPDINSTFCETSIPITTVVRAIGTKGIWLEDVANPSGGFTAEDFQGLSDEFDNQIFATDVAYFGEPTDYDGNGRVVIVTSKEVNKTPGVLGFVVSSDLPPSGCSSSNGGEFYYGRAPDPEGIYESPAPYSLDDAKADAPLLIAHEVTHVIQFGRRLNYPGATAPQSQWEAEGQATLAQEVVGHDIEGNSPGNDYTFATIAGGALGESIDWYSGAFIDLALYYGYLPSGSHAANAPEQCAWLARVSGTPCISDRAVYGVPWSFLRWLSDQFGPGFAGGEKGLQRALIDNKHSGYDTIQEVAGVRVDTLLAQWAAALYTDNLAGIDNPRLRFTSWNLPDIFSHLPSEARLAPRTRTFQSFSDVVGVRGGSTAYFTISGSSAPATAIKLRDASGQAISPGGPMQLWVVRLQ